MADGHKINRREFIKFISSAASCLALAGCRTFSSYTLGLDTGPKENPDKLGVMTYNICYAHGPDHKFFFCLSEREVKHNLNKIVELIWRERMDVVCMNEVDLDSMRTANINQAKYIAKSLGYNYVIEDAVPFIPAFKLGNAVVSKYPLKRNCAIKFGKKNLKENFKHMFKTFVDFDVLLPDGDSINFVQTHYDHRSSETKEEETNMIIDYIKLKREPFVVLGDFNSTPSDEWIKKLMKEGRLHNDKLGIPTSPSWEPKRSIDHIFVSYDLSIENYRTAKIDSSDHLPVMGDIVL